MFQARISSPHRLW